MHASAAGVAAGAAGTAADYLGSGGGGSVAAGGGSGGVAGGDVCRRRLDASGSLLPGCAGSGDGSSGSLIAGAVGGGPDGPDGSGNAAFPKSGGGGAGKSEVGSSHSGADSNASGGGGGSSGISRRRALTLSPDVPFPMFTYDTDENHADIPFPDFSYWGHEFDRLWGAAYFLNGGSLLLTAAAVRCMPAKHVEQVVHTERAQLHGRSKGTMRFGLKRASSWACPLCWARNLACGPRAEDRGKYVVGWDSQLPLLTRLSRGRPWARRKPQVTWRGRHGPGRDWLR